MTASEAQKICKLCGEDCSDRPRTRDLGGRYFCNDCYEKAAARQKSGQTDTPLLADTHDVDATVLAAILDETAAHESPPDTTPEVCARCGKAYERGTTVCTRCGQRAKPAATAPAGDDPTPEFTLPTPAREPAWFIPTWLLVGVPLVFVIGIVLAVLPRGMPSSNGVQSMTAPPNLRETEMFESDTVAFRLPGNWRIRTDYPNFDENDYIVIDDNGGAQLEIRLFESSRTIEEELETRIGRLVAAGYTEREKMEEYGTLTGVGREGATRDGDRDVRYRVFVAKAGVRRMIEIQEICPKADLNRAEPGFNLIAKHLRLK